MVMQIKYAMVYVIIFIWFFILAIRLNSITRSLRHSHFFEQQTVTFKQDGLLLGYARCDFRYNGTYHVENFGLSDLRVLSNITKDT